MFIEFPTSEQNIWCLQVFFKEESEFLQRTFPQCSSGSELKDYIKVCIEQMCSGSTDVPGLCSIWPALRQRTVQVLWEEGRCCTPDGVACCVPTWRRTYHQQRIRPAKITPQQQAVLYNWFLYPAVLCMLHEFFPLNTAFPSGYFYKSQTSLYTRTSCIRPSIA